MEMPESYKFLGLEEALGSLSSSGKPLISDEEPLSKSRPTYTWIITVTWMVFPEDLTIDSMFTDPYFVKIRKRLLL